MENGTILRWAQSPCERLETRWLEARYRRAPRSLSPKHNNKTSQEICHKDVEAEVDQTNKVAAWKKKDPRSTKGWM